MLLPHKFLVASALFCWIYYYTCLYDFANTRYIQTLSKLFIQLRSPAIVPESTECGRHPSEQPGYCISKKAAVNSTTLPRSYGYLLYPAFQPLDVFGPVDALMLLSWQYKLDLHFISETLEPVSTRPSVPSGNRMNSSSYFEVLPTTTFQDAPDLDVLIVPGGRGSRAPTMNSTIRFIEERYPKVKYIFSVCTGALLLSKAGVLDGKHATTNKKAYNSVVATNDKVNWVPRARWVTDGNIWTTSGVSAGIDGIIAFIKCIYGEEVATSIAHGIEYEPHVDSTWDPFADLYNLTATDPEHRGAQQLHGKTRYSMSWLAVLENVVRALKRRQN